MILPETMLQQILAEIRRRQRLARYLGARPGEDQPAAPITNRQHEAIANDQLGVRFPRSIDPAAEGDTWNLDEIFDAVFTGLAHYGISCNKEFTIPPAGPEQDSIRSQPEAL